MDALSFRVSGSRVAILIKASEIEQIGLDPDVRVLEIPVQNISLGFLMQISIMRASTGM